VTAATAAASGATATATEGDGLLLNATGVTKRFGGLVAVHDIDFEIPSGSIVSLIGPNGAGKTTFFNIIAGIYDPTAGVVEFGGQKMIARSKRAWLEPFIWFSPGFIGIIATIIASSVGTSEGEIFIMGGITLIALMSTMVIGVARPRGYQRALRRNA
jgi:ABC-type Na+ transport system ATPase subunit NatA